MLHTDVCVKKPVGFLCGKRKSPIGLFAEWHVARRFRAHASRRPGFDLTSDGWVRQVAAAEHACEDLVLLADQREKQVFCLDERAAEIERFVSSDAEAAARVLGKPTLFNRDKAPEIAGRWWVCGNEAIRRELGWSPAFSLADGIRQTAAWYRAQGLL